jgi:hypothetical protein
MERSARLGGLSRVKKPRAGLLCFEYGRKRLPGHGRHSTLGFTTSQWVREALDPVRQTEWKVYVVRTRFRRRVNHREGRVRLRRARQLGRAAGPPLDDPIGDRDNAGMQWVVQLVFEP